MKSFKQYLTSLILTGSLVGAMPIYAGDKAPRTKKPYAQFANMRITPHLGVSAPATIFISGSLKTYGEKFYGAELRVDCGNGSRHSNGSDWPPYEEGTDEIFEQYIDSSCNYRSGGYYEIKLELLRGEKGREKVIKSESVATINVRGRFDEISDSHNTPDF